MGKGGQEAGRTRRKEKEKHLSLSVLQILFWKFKIVQSSYFARNYFVF